MRQTLSLHQSMLLISNYQSLNMVINNTTKNFKAMALNNRTMKIDVDTIEDSKQIVKTFKEHKFEWYSYENKQLRPIKVMARGIHPSCDPKDILKDLKDKNFMIEDVINIMKNLKDKNSNNKTKIPLPLFMLVFQREEDLNKIHGTNDILGLKVKIEPVRRRSTMISQCKRCQGFGHTKRFCYKAPRCVKCAGKYLTEECKKSRNDIPKCVNCCSDHPASYRGCEVAKELQRRREQQNKHKKDSRNTAKEENYSNNDYVRNNNSETNT